MEDMICNRNRFLTILIFALFFLPSFGFAGEKNRALSYQDYIGRGRSFLLEGEADKAIEECNKAIDLNPEDPIGYYVRGHSYDMKAQYEKAIGDMKRGIALDPKGYLNHVSLSKVHYNYGNLLKRKGRYDRAVEQYSAAIALNPRDRRFYAGRGYACVLKGSLSSAIADLQKACDLGDRNGCHILEALRAM